MKRIALPLALSFAVLSLHAQEFKTGETFFTEVVEVRVTNVDVVVTGKDGKPVRGLKVEDFELYEDGVKKEISNFAEVDESAPAAVLAATPQPAEAPAPKPPDRRRHVTIFVDDAALHPLNRNSVLPHLKTFVDANVRRGDSVMMVAWGSNLSVELEPTSDRILIEAALERLSKRTASAAVLDPREQYETQLADLITSYAVLDPPEKPKWASGQAIVAGFAMRASQETRRRIEALKSVIASMRGVDGRKVLVLLTQNLSINPAEEAYTYLDSIRDSFANPDNSALSDARMYDITGAVTEIAEMANSAGVTLYPIDAGGKAGNDFTIDASRHARISARTRVVSNTSIPTLQAIAAETGGRASAGTTNWQLAFTTIANDLNTYYSLGYHTDGPREDRLKKIEVRLKDKKLAVRTRSAVIEQTPASEMNDAVAANLFRAASTNALGIKAAAGTGAPSAADAEAVLIPLTVTIPTETLTLLPDGTDLTGSFSLFAAFVRKDGAVSKVAKQTHQFRFPADSLKRRKEITVKLDVTADQRTDGISVGVMDEASRATGFAAVKLQ